MDKRFGGPRMTGRIPLSRQLTVVTLSEELLLPEPAEISPGKPSSLNTDDYWVCENGCKRNYAMGQRSEQSDDDLCCVAANRRRRLFSAVYSSGLANGDRSVSSRGTYDYGL